MKVHLLEMRILWRNKKKRKRKKKRLKWRGERRIKLKNG
jgi:hypothetical protein